MEKDESWTKTILSVILIIYKHTRKINILVIKVNHLVHFLSFIYLSILCPDSSLLSLLSFLSFPFAPPPQSTFYYINTEMGMTPIGIGKAWHLPIYSEWAM